VTAALRAAVCGFVGLAWLAGCVPHPLYRSGPQAPDAGAQPTGEEEVAPEPALQPRDKPLPKPPSLVLQPPALRPVDPTRISTENAYQLGVASYYGRERQGRRTASGERYSMYRMTAAHRILPLGTLIKLTNLANGKWVVVKVNDRGPFARQRIVDVSYAAALELDMVEEGRAEVMIELVDGSP
jgi:rare lipoprotein A